MTQSKRQTEFEEQARKTVEEAVLTGELTHPATVMRVLIARAVKRGEITIGGKRDVKKRLHRV
jgi:hypothetical protein